ncbi:uncharacterized protein N7518_003075 [Penicillium psychrosexuale]|uniref:uncharacterized protein n=1 Tax=Penicillium psychrosexuale TaxID=1002107 RepID=UPI0025454295|nr:uncharacterized protein N7518_003075 [Penicillium psychrosexuale]KAJ5801007.1 hypothetical protein N7518_003075 [Penicillium psychrosexuale]
MVKFAIRNPDIPDNTLRVQDLNPQGFMINDDDSFKVDFTMFIRGELQYIDATQDLAITAFVSPNLLPANEQLKALEAVSRTKCFGNLPGNKQNGYSLRKMVIGHGSVGPPGTGKTRTAKRIILTLASLGLKVFVTAGSNKGVNNLFHPVFQATRNDQELRAWCGPIVRFSLILPNSTRRLFRPLCANKLQACPTLGT